MFSRIKPEHRRVIVFFGSLWAVAIAFILLSTLLPG
jgi:hypothetical protein